MNTSRVDVLSPQHSNAGRHHARPYSVSNDRETSLLLILHFKAYSYLVPPTSLSKVMGKVLLVVRLTTSDSSSARLCLYTSSETGQKGISNSN